MKTWVTRYGSPETRMEVEHEDGECPACVVAGSLEGGDVLFVEVEVHGDADRRLGVTVVRRVEGVGQLLGISCVSCRIVSRQDADAEIVKPKDEKSTDVFSQIFHIGKMILDPGYMAHEAAKLGARYGEVILKHDPCSGCGHGRLVHKTQNYSDFAARERDEALSPTRCRHGHYPNGTPCGCECWIGVETPVPSFDSIVRKTT
jgi:hypothetical protein